MDWQFLTIRCHRTKVGNDLSDVVYIISGVIQGSCLGPILFQLYINDLPDVFDDAVTLKLFADDVKLYSRLAALSLNTPTNIDE